MGAIKHTKRQKELFLAHFRELGRVDLAALATGVGRSAHYTWLQDIRYQKDFEKVRCEVGQMLADEAHRRAYSGVSRPVLHKGVQVKVDDKPLEEISYSDVLLIFLLKAHDPQRYRDQVSIQHTGKDGSPLFDTASIRAYMKSAPEDGQ